MKTALIYTQAVWLKTPVALSLTADMCKSQRDLNTTLCPSPEYEFLPNHSPAGPSINNKLIWVATTFYESLQSNSSMLMLVFFLFSDCWLQTGVLYCWPFSKANCGLLDWLLHFLPSRQFLVFIHFSRIWKFPYLDFCSCVICFYCSYCFFVFCF